MTAHRAVRAAFCCASFQFTNMRDTICSSRCYDSTGGWIQSLVIKLALSASGSGKPGDVICLPTFCVSQRLTPTGERSGLQTRIAATESVSLCVLMKS
jgi:hypothetical protein